LPAAFSTFSPVRAMILARKPSDKRRPSSNRVKFPGTKVAWISVGWGVIVGAIEGSSLGHPDGAELTDGVEEGAGVGEEEGDADCDGATEGMLVGMSEGLEVGAAEGDVEGLVDGDVLGAGEGAWLGFLVGPVVGSVDGAVDGELLGQPDGCSDGVVDGTTLGELDGEIEGDFVEIDADPNPNFLSLVSSLFANPKPTTIKVIPTTAKQR
jgi:hypothetical protein